MSRLTCCTALWLICLLPLAAVAGKNIAPTVSLTAPANGASFTAPATITLAATATDPDGSIAKVEFYRGGTTLIGTDQAAPYTVTWSNVPAGSYSLTAKATDNLGKAATSAVVTITVNAPPPNTPPTVNLTTPTSGANFTEPATIELGASAADADGSVVKVEFYQGTTLIGTATSAPYTYTWTAVPAGSYTLTAKATDDQGASTTSSPVGITVNRPPLVVLTTPSSCSTFDTSSGIYLHVDATDPDGFVVKVDFYAGDTLIGSAANSAPYRDINTFGFPWTGMSAGTYTLTARATDNRGAVTVSDPVVLPIAPANQPPAVSLTAPASGAVFGSTEPILIAAEASDSDGSIAKVEFYAGWMQIGTATTPPYSVVWSGTKSAGQYTLTARALDNRGAETVSQDVSITINTNAPPTVNLTAPANGASYAEPATVSLAASAADSDGSLARVDFYAGATLIGSVTVAPYTMTWSNVPAGSYSLTAKATDNLGATATSAPVNVTVNAPPPNTPPTVSLTSPEAGAGFQAPATVTLAASAADADGSIARVEFYRDTTLLGTATAAPYTYTWSQVPAGSYMLTAKATDNLGATMTSAPVSILVNAPGLTIQSPADGATVAGDRVTVSGSFQAPPNSGVTVNGVVAALSGSSFYAFNVPIALGTQTLTATLTTLDGYTASESITVTGAPAPAVQVRAEPQTGLSSLKADFTITNTTSSPVQKVEIDSDGNGTFDYTLSGDFFITYTTPWTYRTVVKVTLEDESVYTQSFPIVVQDVRQTDALLRDVYLGMLDRLKSGDIAGSLNAVTASVYEKYSAVFNALGTDLPAAVDALGTFRSGRISDNWAEYLIVRDTPEGPQGFLMYFIRGEDGVWRIDAM